MGWSRNCRMHMMPALGIAAERLKRAMNGYGSGIEFSFLSDSLAATLDFP